MISPSKQVIPVNVPTGGAPMENLSGDVPQTHADLTPPIRGEPSTSAELKRDISYQVFLLRCAFARRDLGA